MSNSKGQRTKGNLKPSSSAKAAELLSQSGLTPGVGFLGFGAAPVSSTFASAEGIIEEGDRLTDALGEEVVNVSEPKFRVAIKQLSKKDPITKLKALKELEALVADTVSDVELPTALSIWTRAYLRLAMDANFKVRESAHTVTQVFAKKMGKSLKPYVKSVVSLLLFGEQDPYGLVAASASATFLAAFPPHKRQSVLEYARAEIFELCTEILLESNALRYADKSCEGDENAEFRNNRLALCCLSSLRSFVSSVPERGEVSFAQPLFDNLFGQARFWTKYSKHAAVNVRAAFFRLIAVLLNEHPDACRKNCSKLLVTSVVNAMEDGEPDVAQHVWLALLRTLDTFENFFEHVNLHKAFLPKLNAIVKRGCGSCDYIIAPYLLPVFSKISLSTDAERLSAGLKFLTNFHEGINALASKAKVSENDSVVLRAFLDCVLFVSVRYLTTDEKAVIQVLELTNHLLICLLKSSSSFAAKSLFANIASFLENLCKLRQKHENLVIVIDSFFDAFDRSVQILITDEDEADSLTNVASLFASFADIKPFTDLTELTQKRIAKVCANLLECFRHSKSVAALKAFHMVVRKFASKDLSVAICFATQPRLISAYDLTHKELLPVLRSAECPQDVAQSLVDVILTLVAFGMDLETEQRETLKHLTEVPSVTAKFCFLGALLAARNDSNFLSDWMQSAAFSDFFLAAFQLLCKEESAAKWWPFVTPYFSATVGEVPLLSVCVLEETLNLLTVFVENVSHSSATPLLESVSLMCDVSRTFISANSACCSSTAGQKLLISLFDLCIEDFGFSDELLLKLQETWQFGLKSFASTSSSGELFSKSSFPVAAANKLKQNVVSHRAVADSSRLSRLVSCAHLFVKTLSVTRHADQLAFAAQNALKQFLPLASDFARFSDSIDNLTCLNAIAKGNLCANKLSIESKTLSDFLPALALVDYGLQLFCSFSASAEHLSDLRAERPSTVKRALFSSFSGLDEVLHSQISDLFAWSCVLLCAANEQFAVTQSPSSGSAMHEMYESIALALGNILQSETLGADTEFTTLVGTKLYACSLKKGCVWALGLRYFLSILRSIDVVKQQHVSTSLLERLAAESFPPSVQVVETCQALNAIENATATESFCLDQLTKFSNAQSDLCLTDRWRFRFALVRSFKLPSLQISLLDEWLTVKDEMEQHLAFNENLCDASTDSLLFSVELQSFLIAAFPHVAQFSVEQRDFVCCALLTWLHAIAESNLATALHRLFAQRVFTLFRTCAAFAVSLSADAELHSHPHSDSLSAFLVEWQEFFLDGSAPIVLAQFVKLAAFANANSTDFLWNQCLEAVSEATTFCTKGQLLNNALPPLLSPDLDELKYPQQLQSLLLQIMPFIRSPHWPAQLAAFMIAKKIISNVGEYECVNNTEETEASKKEMERPLPSYLLYVIEKSYAVIEHSISQFQVLELQPNTELFHQTVAYCFAWKLSLEFIRSIPVEEVYGYSAFLKNSGLLGHFVLFLFCVMPDNPVAVYRSRLRHKLRRTPGECLLSSASREITREARKASALEDASGPALKTEKTSDEAKMPFVSELEFVFDSSKPLLDTMTEVDQLKLFACHLYYESLRLFPALIRQWWNNQDRKSSSMIERFTAKFISPILCNDELLDVAKANTATLGNMKVNVRPAAKEVVAVYGHDDMSMELVVKLASTHPLGQVAIETGQRVGVPKELWRKWLLQLNVFLMHQNGSLLNGLLAWKRNIDKHLEGVEDCMICMMAIHGSNFQLPRVTCKQCKKKFHSDCLYKWFNTSSHAHCPLCRSPF